MNKELELEAEKYALRFEKNKPKGYNGESLSIRDIGDMVSFIAGATSKYVEKQKLEFAIKQLKKCSHAPTIRLGIVLEELEQKLSEL